MDSLTATLSSLRFRARLYCRVEAGAPWGLSAPPSDVATFHGVLEGEGLLRVGVGAAPVKLARGDVAIVCHGEAHSIRDALQSPVRPIHSLMRADASTKVVRAGGAGAGSTIVCGCFFSEANDAPPMFSLLPPVLHVHASHAPGMWPLLDLLSREAAREAQGSDAIVARLSEALFIEIARWWSKKEARGAGSWMRSLSDPRIAAVLGEFHRAPEEPHTLDSASRTAGMSRSAFAERFKELVGEAPMTYLIRFRLYHASVMLRDTQLGIGEIATRVGYETEASLTKAFTREMGKPPGAYRRHALAVEAKLDRPKAPPIMRAAR